MSRFHKAVALILVVWSANVILNFVVRGFTAHHADAPAAQALNNLT
jgi:hypothetical protein